MAKKTAQDNGFQQFKADIKGKCPGRLYFLHGEEHFLLNHYLVQLKKVLLDPVTESFNYHRFNSENFDLQAFVDSVENLPMMAEKTMVQVDDVDIFKMSEPERDVMTQVFSDIPDYCTVIFTYLTVEWKPDKRYKKLWSSIENNGAPVEFAKQDQKDLTAWITRHFAARQKRISVKLCQYLIDITDGTMTTLIGEIEKISAYSGSSEICKEDIDAVTEPVLEAIVFDMTNMLGEGRYADALIKLQQLLKLQQEPIAILGAVGQHFRRISVARSLLDQGKTGFEMQKLCGITDYPARKFMDSARRFRPEFCTKAAQLILETDYRMKTSFDDAERLIELLLIELAMEARNV